MSLSRPLALPITTNSAPQPHPELASQGAGPIWPVLFAGSSAKHSGRKENGDGCKRRCPILANWTVLQNRSILPPRKRFRQGGEPRKSNTWSASLSIPSGAAAKLIRVIQIRVKDVLDLLAAGVSDHEILEGCPDLQADDVKACLGYAAAQADHAVLRVA